MSELTNSQEFDYNNKVRIEVKTSRNISAEDMKTIQEACNTIIDTAEKYFIKPAPNKSIGEKE